MSTTPNASVEAVAIPDRPFFTAEQLLSGSGWTAARIEQLTDWMAIRGRRPVIYRGAVWHYRTLVTEFAAAQLRSPITFVSDIPLEDGPETIPEDEDAENRRTITVRMHPALHRFLKELANEKGMSLNELCVDLLTKPLADARAE